MIGTLRSVMAAWATRAGALLIVAALMAGCDSRAGAVKDAMDRLIAANDAHDGETVASLYCRSTIEHYDELLRLAREATKSRIMAMTLSERAEVLTMRLEYPLAQLKALTGREYIKRSVGAGHWVVEWGVEDYGRIKVTGSTAWMEVKKPDERPTRGFSRRGRDTRRAYNIRFYLEDDVWKMDETSIDDLWNEMLLEDQRDSGIGEEQYLLELLGDGSDKPVPANIWDPPKR